MLLLLSADERAICGPSVSFTDARVPAPPECALNAMATTQRNTHSPKTHLPLMQTWPGHGAESCLACPPESAITWTLPFLGNSLNESPCLWRDTGDS